MTCDQHPVHTFIDRTLSLTCDEFLFLQNREGKIKTAERSYLFRKESASSSSSWFCSLVRKTDFVSRLKKRMMQSLWSSTGRGEEEEDTTVTGSRQQEDTMMRKREAKVAWSHQWFKLEAWIQAWIQKRRKMSVWINSSDIKDERSRNQKQFPLTCLSKQEIHVFGDSL